jgi:hypothetical protein
LGDKGRGGQGRTSLSGEGFDSVIQDAQFCFLGDIPDGLATVDAVVGALVAVFAQGDASELETLLNVVGVRWASRTAHTAGHLFNGGEVPSFALVQPVVHAFV